MTDFITKYFTLFDLSKTNLSQTLSESNTKCLKISQSDSALLNDRVPLYYNLIKKVGKNLISNDPSELKEIETKLKDDRSYIDTNIKLLEKLTMENITCMINFKNLCENDKMQNYKENAEKLNVMANIFKNNTEQIKKLKQFYIIKFINLIENCNNKDERKTYLKSLIRFSNELGNILRFENYELEDINKQTKINVELNKISTCITPESIKKNYWKTSTIILIVVVIILMIMVYVFKKQIDKLKNKLSDLRDESNYYYKYKMPQKKL